MANDQGRHGLTLMEILVSTGIVGFLLVASLNSVGSVYEARTVTSTRGDAYVLAEELMAEILQTSYEDPDGSPIFGREFGESGGDRSDRDDVDDYDNWSASPPEQRDGTPVPNMTGWTRSVTVNRVNPNDPNLAIGSEKGLKKITVTVTGPNGESATLTALRAGKGTLELKPPINKTYITQGRTKLQLGNGQSRQSGTPVFNYAEDSP